MRFILELLTQFLPAIFVTGNLRMSYYTVLGLDPETYESITQQEIRGAFRKRAKETHPDRGSSEDDSNFKAVREAYDVLSSPEARRKYDWHLKRSKEYQYFRVDDWESDDDIRADHPMFMFNTQFYPPQKHEERSLENIMNGVLGISLLFFGFRLLSAIRASGIAQLMWANFYWRGRIVWFDLKNLFRN